MSSYAEDVLAIQQVLMRYCMALDSERPDLLAGCFVEGAQVHRSWWVAASALSTQRHRDKLVLANGVEVPVSRSFRIAARQRGWLSPADPRD